jgi:hypothetical protein
VLSDLLTDRVYDALKDVEILGPGHGLIDWLTDGLRI